jgi:TrmH family RNA methyltransferase
MIRTAAAFGLDVAIGPGGTDPWSPKVLRAGAAGHFHIGIEEIDDIGAIEATKVATVIAGGERVDLLPAGRLAILIGSEAHGLPEDVVARCELRVTIPMSGHAESLNAAAAAAIMGYALAHR